MIDARQQNGGCTVAVLGTGRFGRPVAGRLLATGFTVRVWNRTAARAAPLVLDGAYVAPFPARAAKGADILLTFLPDAEALQAAATGRLGALASLRFGAIWLHMGALDLCGSSRLRQLALGHGVRFVEARFTGSEQAARDGALLVLASGSGSARIGAEPVFDAIARRTVWTGYGRAASQLRDALDARAS
jgi:3-hydroxyisobutyrate dehydrogenase